MSQPDLLTQLRESRPMAPAELREHVRRIAERAEPETAHRRFDWRRILVVAVPVAAAAAGAAILITGGDRHTATLLPPAATYPGPASAQAPFSGKAKSTPDTLAVGAAGSANTSSVAGGAAAPVERSALPKPSSTRVQRITAALELRVRDAQAVSDATKQAAQIARSLGGFSSRLDVQTSGTGGYADIVLRIPKANVQKAVARLSALGTITGENVSIQDLQTQVDATTRKIEQLQAKLTAWQEQPQTTETERHIASLTTALAKLRHGRNATVRAASLATVSLQLSTRPAPTPAHHGRSPLHGLGVAFHWAWIGAVYALALGAPALLLLGIVWLAARAVRRRREEALLSRS